MGSCENPGESVCASVPVAVSGEAEVRTVGDDVVGDVPEMKCSLDLGALGIGDGNATLDNVRLDTESTVMGSSLERDQSDRSEATLCNSLGEGLQELVVEPMSSLDISSHASQSGKDSAGKSSCEGDGNLDDEIHTLKDDDGDVTDKCQSALDGLRGDVMDGSAVIAERKFEQIRLSRPDLTTGCANSGIERGDVSGVECVLNRMSFDEACELDSDHTEDMGKDLEPSEMLEDADGHTVSMAQHVPESNLSCVNHFSESLMEAVSDAIHDGPVTSLIMPDKSITVTTVAAIAADHNHHIVESFGHEENIKIGSVRIEGDLCEFKSLPSPLSLRRSSRSRKTVQKLQRGKNATQVSKKASKLSLSQTVDLFSVATRKKRSCLNRSVCSSGWDFSGSFFKFFEQSNEVTANQASDDGKSKMKARQRSRKRNKNKVVASSPLADEKQELPRRPIRLKVTFGKREENTASASIHPEIDNRISVPASDINKTSENVMENTSGNVVEDQVPKETCMLVQCCSSTSQVQFRGTNLDMCSTSEKSRLSDSSQLVEPEKLGCSYAVKFLDPGTSPDSEVIDSSSVVPNLLPNNFEKNMSGSISVPRSHTCPASSKSSKNKRNKKGKLFGADSAGVNRQHLSPDAEKSLKDEMCQKINNNFRTDGADGPCEIPLSNTSGSGSELVSMELLSVNDEGFKKAPSLDHGADRVIGIESADSGNSNHLLTPSESQLKKNSKGSKIKGKSKTQPKIANAKRNRKEPSGQRKGTKKSASKHGIRENAVMDEAHQNKGQPKAGDLELVCVEKTDCSLRLAPQNLSCAALSPNAVAEQTLPPRVAWVCCDECEKWRCIPAKLADVIEETNGQWTCKDNQDQAFADCSIPQEKSNSEINAELQISDEEDGRGGHFGSKGSGIRPSGDPQQSTWMLVKANIFLHRRRKTQTMDEIMVCHCKPPADGTLGCGSQCLNRMLNIECVNGTCPCGDLCSNQQFQRRLYANLSWFRSGRKGYGLQVLEDISEGRFLIEYVGEVLDLQSYEARQKDYALKGHKHFYFMTLNGNEVIDACSKGNLGRFVNHSCDPNCRTEKWVVNGEICVGLFALRNIRKGEELTFDYNYVRVFGAAAKKCYCGSLKCRGYIGGDPLNAEVVIQGDSDEEFPEPVVVDENGKLDHSLEKNVVDSSCSQDVLKGCTSHEQNLAEVIPDMNMVKALEECSNDVNNHSTNLTDLSAVDEVCESSNRLAASESDKEKNEPIAAVQHKTTPENLLTSSTSSNSDVLPLETAVSKPLPGLIDSSDKVSGAIIVEGQQPISKARPRMKVSRPSKSVKNRKSSSISISDEKALLTAQFLKSHFFPFKPKKLLEASANGHLEGVEDKLNELLDGDGGICKKKDASKGYLKLLLLTAASGDSGDGGAIQSNRELSMILDALLKTKSRGVLLDIINKNGLQMLHNMLKLYRKDFIKTPILRKLLKVLEFLADKEILSVERIIGDSLRPGVESFRESILNLTEHEDKKVHQIARNFRDRWIPRHLRNRYNVMDNIDRKREFTRTSNCNRFSGSYHLHRDHGERILEPMENTKQTASLNNSLDTRNLESFSPQLINFQSVISRPRKRKSRWDQPADPASLRRSKEQRIERSSPGKVKRSPIAEANTGVERDVSENNDCSKMDGVMEGSEDDVPPGFSCLQDTEDAPPGFSSSLPRKNVCSLECPPGVSAGELQERFNPGIPVAYGIPYSVLQQFGSLQSGTADSWEIAPSFPFKPFPPLPPHPYNKKAHPNASPSEGVMGNRDCKEAQPGPAMPSSSGPTLPHIQNSGPTSHDTSHHGRGSWNAPGRRFHKQKILRPPWLRNLDGRCFKGNHPRNRAFDRNMENIAYEQNSQHLADVNQNVECAGNSW
ncbi:hypothetical protein vseg_018819 [Gypsophila vaccaria]